MATCNLAYNYDVDIQLTPVENGFVIKVGHLSFVAKTLKEALKIVAKEYNKK